MARRGKEFWTAADVLCPFYISDDRQQRSVRCEGFSEGSSLTSRFNSLEQREKHMGSYCAGKYQRCPVYGCTYRAKYDD